MDGTTEAQAASPHDRDDDLESLVHELRAELRTERELRKQREEEIAALADQNDELEQRVDELEERLDEQPDVSFEDTGDIKTLSIGGHPLGHILSTKASKSELDATDNVVDELWEWYESFDQDTIQSLLEIDDRITAEQKTRSQQDTKIRRELKKLADEVDVDLAEAEVSGEDKIQRLIVHGPDDITDRVYDVHERAREVLLHAGEWGSITDDKFGKRITLTSPTVRENLELVRTESLQSKQVKDVFDKIVELAEDSPRKARVGKTDDGVNKLLIHLNQEEMN